MAPSSRRSQASGEDRFVAGTLYLLTWAQRNSRALVLGTVAVAILFGGVLYYVDFQRRVREAASTEIRAIRFQLEVGSTTDIVERIRTFLVQYDGTAYAREARMLLAHSLLLQNRAAEAIEPARQASEGAIGDDLVATRAAFLLAAAYEEVADTASAIRVYEEIGRAGRLTLERRRGMEGAARLKAESGDAAGAAALYDRLTELVPQDDPSRSLYEMRAAELRTAALTEGGAEGA